MGVSVETGFFGLTFKKDVANGIFWSGKDFGFVLPGTNRVRIIGPSSQEIGNDATVSRSFSEGGNLKFSLLDTPI